jgi:hypothetical protein
MKRLGLVLLALALLVGCGGGSSSGSGSSGPTIDGNWSAVLQYSDGTIAYAFTTSLKQSSGSTVTVTNFSFTAAPPCVESAESETAELDGGFKNNSSFLMSIFAGPPDSVGIEMTGHVQNNTITGSWLSRGLTSCHASGEFTLTRM